ncbi:MAG: hypothetical protein H0X04_00055 [Chthoniobacterales bacterium]|nr:hypothetical protein [Chthoniobacterales bacterium]
MSAPIESGNYKYAARGTASKILARETKQTGNYTNAARGTGSKVLAPESPQGAFILLFY